MRYRTTFPPGNHVHAELTLGSRRAAQAQTLCALNHSIPLIDNTLFASQFPRRIVAHLNFFAFMRVGVIVVTNLDLIPLS
jgi:hypothetical protein